MALESIGVTNNRNYVDVVKNVSKAPQTQMKAAEETVKKPETQAPVMSAVVSAEPKNAEKVLAMSDKVVSENNLTTMMVTHNMRDAIIHGNRLIMMDAGHIVVDISGEDKKKLTVPDLLDMFSKASGSTEANDAMLLSK